MCSSDLALRAHGAKIAAFALSFTVAAAPAFAQSFFAGKSVELIISSGVGGGYDAYSRLIAQHMERHIPGNPRIVPKNMTGAGGIVAMNYLATVAAKDGTSIGQIQNTVPFDPLYGKPGVQFDPLKLEYLGSANGETPLVFTWHASPTRTFADLQKRETPMAVAAGSISQFHALAMNDLAGAKIKIVAGYPGGNEGLLAMERGEVEGASSNWLTIKHGRPDWVREKKIKVILQDQTTRSRDLPDTPALGELGDTPEAKQLFGLYASTGVIGRSFFAPPGVPALNARILRDGFAAMAKDAEFIADAQKIGAELEIAFHEDIEREVAKTLDAPASAIARAQAIFAVR